jgi:ribosomal protein S4E
MQLNSHDGRSFAIKVDDPFDTQVGFRPFDSLKISLPKGEVLEHIVLEPDAYVSIIGGSKIGESGVVKEVPEQRGPNLRGS